MDSLKIQKVTPTTSSIVTAGTTSPKATSSGPSIPLSVRFNAGEESIDGLFQPFNSNNNNCSSTVTASTPPASIQVTSTSDGTTSSGGFNVGVRSGCVIGDGTSAASASSLSSSISNTFVSDGISTNVSQHQQNTTTSNPDELNTRNNFLQGNFFSRKRSGSIEGVSPTTVSSNLFIGLTTSEASSAGTWKMIKGKVSQTIEDIKSSKSNSTGAAIIGASNTTLTGSLSIPTVTVKGCDKTYQQKDTNVEYPYSISEIPSVLKQRNSMSSDRQKYHNKNEEWDTDLDTEIVLDLETEQSRLKRGFANFKSKVKSKQQSSMSLSSSNSSTNLNTLTKDTSPSRIAGPSSSFRQSFMRRRRPNKDAEKINQSNNASLNTARSSISTPLTAAAAVAGATVEIATAVPIVSGKLDSDPKRNHGANKDIEIESGVEMMEETIPSTVNILPMPNAKGFEETVQSGNNAFNSTVRFDTPVGNEIPPQYSVDPYNGYQFYNFSLLRRLYTAIKSLPICPIIALVIVLIIPLNDFLRGILACLLCIIISHNLIEFLGVIIDNFVMSYRPERIPFKIPDYHKMPECTVPAVKEELKYYDGWMNEIDNYDPDNFQLSLTNSVYVKLEGSVLHVSSTTAHIPKRMMWNEKPIDLTSIPFQTCRTYNLNGCRVELLPVGLAAKRHFSRKYPIQLIVKASQYTFTNLEEGKLKKKGNKKIEKLKKANRKEVKIGKVHVKDGTTKETKDSNLGDTLLKADFKQLQNDINPDYELKNMTIPSGDEVRILLFARTARHKEDWFRHFIAARDGDIYDKEIRIPSVRFVDDVYLENAAQRAAELSGHEFTDIYSISDFDEEPSSSTKEPQPQDSADKDDEVEVEEDFIDLTDDLDTIEGLIMTASASRNDPKYIYFMSLYQRACNQTRIPVYKKQLKRNEEGVKHRKRSVRNQQELWKSIDQSLFLGRSGSVVWANVLAGRILFSLLQNEFIKEKITMLIQKKINAIKLPGFMEDVTITSINLGNKPPLVHRVSQPLIDERGVWVDADITYDGLCHVTVTTKINLLRLKRPATSARSQADESSVPTAIQTGEDSRNLNLIEGPGVDIDQVPPHLIIYDSDAESIGSSSSESDNIEMTNVGMERLNTAEGTQGNARRIFKFVDRLATSHFFQYATEISYVQKAMENMNTTITLGLDIRGLVGRGTINMPPPPSDRIWLGFRSPPRIWLTARPAVGDKSVDWSIVTNVIEGKLCEAISKYLVVPNMVDIAVPYIGTPATEL